MAEISVGVRELKDHLSEYLRRVRAGESIVITDRGEPIARLTPGEAAGQTGDARLSAAVADGRLSWGGGEFRPRARGVHVYGDRRISDLLLEDRG